MRTFDLQIIWSAKTPYTIPGFLALHLQIEAKRTAKPISKAASKWFLNLDSEKKAQMSFIHLN